MKKFFYLFVVILIFASCDSNPNSSEVKKRDLQFVQLEVAVDGMTCGGCENTVQTELSKLSGVGNVVASHVDKTVKVQVDTMVTKLDEIEKNIERVGYTILK